MKKYILFLSLSICVTSYAQNNLISSKYSELELKSVLIPRIISNHFQKSLIVKLGLSWIL